MECAGYEAIAPLAERWTKVGDAVRKKTGSLIGGYVFLGAQAEPDWIAIAKDRDVLRVLQYDGGERALRGEDLAFVEWLQHYEGLIEISRVIREGTKIRFVGGPLADFDGQVLRVNKNRRQVLLSIGSGEGLLRKMWCSIEYIEEAASLEGQE